MFDMAVHNPPTREALAEMNEMEVYDSIYRKLHPTTTTTIPLDTGLHHYKWVHNEHLLAGYDAGYYPYICAQVFEAYLFQTTFAAKPRCRKAWEKFRSKVLECGGSRDESEVLKAHLGGTGSKSRAAFGCCEGSSRLS
jgi:metallopeptidase MepB